MLVLSRRRKQSIRIGENITITVLNIHASEVHLGIDAPQNVAIHRLEVHVRIQEEKSKLVESSDNG